MRSICQNLRIFLLSPLFRGMSVLNDKKLRQIQTTQNHSMSVRVRVLRNLRILSLVISWIRNLAHVKILLDYAEKKRSNLSDVFLPRSQVYFLPPSQGLEDEAGVYKMSVLQTSERAPNTASRTHGHRRVLPATASDPVCA